LPPVQARIIFFLPGNVRLKPWNCELVPHMKAVKPNRWLIPLVATMAAVLCCCLLVAGLGAYWWVHDALQAAVDVPILTQEPSPSPAVIRRTPEPVELETADAIAHSALPQRDLLDLAHRLGGLPEPLAANQVGVPPAYGLGDSQVFWLHSAAANAYFTATASLRYETEHAYWWIEDGYEVPAEDLQTSALTFENQTYPTNHRYFGSEWTPGVDGDPHIYLYLGDVPGVGGYFSSPDEYPREVRPHSNEHEMFYINLDNAQPGNDYFDGILAHEFQHMIHWAMDRDEDGWVNEGLSELAGQVNGYDVGGSDQVFSQVPDTQLTTWPEPEFSAPHYGASYLFMAYFLQQYGEEAIRRLVAEPANGIAGFEAVLAAVDPAQQAFDKLFADWVAANFLDSSDPADSRYSYATLQVSPPSLAAQYSTYPVSQQATVHQYGTDYILLEGQGDVTVEFTGSLVVGLVGNDTHLGRYQWWSNRGDEADTTLTRAFDLSGLDQATLQAWMWYDLETDYDYAYAEVSTDDGQTWTLLANEHTTTTNPSDNSYGPALTGISGGGATPEWIWQTFDLSPYTGGPVLIRFEVITDDTVNHPGFCLDGISIPELGYADDAEHGDDGWQARGWVRVADHVPQQYIVQLITLGGQTYLERMVLNGQNHGTLAIHGLGETVDRAVLVVSAVTPVTTEWASYGYQVH
jgi:immune inhibitor A